MDNETTKKPIYKRWWFWVVIVIAFLAIISSFGTNGDNESGSNNGNPSNNTTQNSITDNKATVGEKMALSSAKNYLRTMGFSKQGLIDQLEFEGFTNEEATYGAEQAYK
jgi:hypothetical protein